MLVLSRSPSLAEARDGLAQVAGRLQVGGKISQVGRGQSSVYHGGRVLIGGAGACVLC